MRRKNVHLICRLTFLSFLRIYLYEGFTWWLKRNSSKPNYSRCIDNSWAKFGLNPESKYYSGVGTLPFNFQCFTLFFFSPIKNDSFHVPGQSLHGFTVVRYVVMFCFVCGSYKRDTTSKSSLPLSCYTTVLPCNNNNNNNLYTGQTFLRSRICT